MQQGGGKVLIFVRTITAAEDLATLLQQKFGSKCDAMHGKRKQEQRDPWRGRKWERKRLGCCGCWHGTLLLQRSEVGAIRNSRSLTNPPTNLDPHEALRNHHVM